MQENNYKVYIIKRVQDDVVMYVGLTRRSLSERYHDHVTRLKIKRYEYQIELVSDGLTNFQAAQLEKKLIIHYNTLKIGWNKSPGSINGVSNYHSEEQKKKWSNERKGKPVSKEHAEKNRIARLGQKNSPEHQAKIIRPKEIMCVETGYIYKSAREAAKELNLQYSKISLVCNGKRNSTGGLHFIFTKKQ